MTTIHQRIKERRLALGLKSHQALATLIGVSWQTVQLWEKEGGTAPNRNRIAAVAAALQVSTSWLVHGEAETGADVAGAAPAQPERPAPIHTQWVTSEEDRLLTLFRTTDDDGRAAILRAAEAMPRSAAAKSIGHKV